jgi:hypothetical protein
VTTFTEKELLESALDDLRADLRLVNGNPLIPSAVKSACEKTLRVLQLLIERQKNG